MFLLKRRTASLITNYVVPFKKRRHCDATIIWVARTSKHKPSWSFSNSSLIHTELRFGLKNDFQSNYVTTEIHQEAMKGNQNIPTLPFPSPSHTLHEKSIIPGFCMKNFPLQKDQSVFLPSIKVTGPETRSPSFGWFWLAPLHLRALSHSQNRSRRPSPLPSKGGIWKR